MNNITNAHLCTVKILREKRILGFAGYRRGPDSPFDELLGIGVSSMYSIS